MTPARDGTNVVFTTDRHVVKLYPPCWAAGATAEWAILGHVDGRLGVRTPAIVATGYLDHWPYLVMTRLSGTILADVWPGLVSQERRALARQIGEILARLHALPTAGLSAYPALAERWPRLLGLSIQECVDRHRGHGAPEEWLARLPAFLEHLPPLHPAGFTPVLVGGDVHCWHLLVTEANGAWRIVGLFDFDDAMLGWWEYDFAIPALSMMARQPTVLAECLHGYAGSRLARDVDWSRRLMAYSLLNRYWGLDFILNGGDPDRRFTTFDELEQALFAIA